MAMMMADLLNELQFNTSKMPYLYERLSLQCVQRDGALFSYFIRANSINKKMYIRVL